MGSLSDYGENAFIGHLCGSAHSPAATVYLALATADPTDAATGAAMNEVANSGNYSRTALAFGAAAARAITQNADCTFPQASAAWGTVTHWAITDSIIYGASFAPVAGNTPKVASGEVSISITASSGEGFTTQFCNWMLDLMFRNQAYSQPASYIALLTAIGDDADTTLSADEVTGTDYARVLLNKAGGASPSWEAVSGGASQNEEAVTFPTVGSGGWDEVVGMAIVDVSDNVLAFDNDQVVDQTPNEGDTVTFAIGALDVSMT